MNDTICAQATPPVHSPIAIIRISGPDSLRVASSIFKVKKQKNKQFVISFNQENFASILLQILFSLMAKNG
jgi:tRNA U34 5-carboxymethylaminomethyl modifying GTPase MnmE/TrmE